MFWIIIDITCLMFPFIYILLAMNAMKRGSAGWSWYWGFMIGMVLPYELLLFIASLIAYN